MTKKQNIATIIVVIMLIISPILGYIVFDKIKPIYLLRTDSCISTGENRACHPIRGCEMNNHDQEITVKGYECRCQGFDNTKPKDCPSGYICDGWPKGWHCFKKK